MNFLYLIHFWQQQGYLKIYTSRQETELYFILFCSICRWMYYTYIFDSSLSLIFVTSCSVMIMNGIRCFLSGINVTQQLSSSIKIIWITLYISTDDLSHDNYDMSFFFLEFISQKIAMKLISVVSQPAHDIRPTLLLRRLNVLTLL